MTNNDTTGDSEGRVLLLSIASVFAVNLGILAYAVSVAAPSADHGSKSDSATTVAPPVPAAQPLRPAPVPVNLAALPSSAQIKEMYLQHCAACHGTDGRGNGPAATQLFPRPRDFVESPFRFAPGASGEGELRGAIERTISDGVPRSSMPGFHGVLSETIIAGLADHVIALRSQQGGQSVGSAHHIDVGQRPPTSPELLAHGAALYRSVGCNVCHGEGGNGDGTGSANLVDSLGRPVRPADLASGLFKSGQTPPDLARLILAGVPGTPMISWEPVLAKKNPDGTANLTDVWALVAFIESLQPKHPTIGEASGARLEAQLAADPRMLTDASHMGWLGVEPTDILIKPLWQREERITHMAARIARTSECIALCLDWRDETPDLARESGQFPDAVAAMFAQGDDVPALPMGVAVEGHKPGKPVNLWHWQATRQVAASDPSAPTAGQNLATPLGYRVFGAPVAAAPTGDSVPAGGAAKASYGAFPSFAAATEADNVHDVASIRGHSVLESNAAGFGTLTLQEADQQDVEGAAVWSGGLWRVVMWRNLPAHGDTDVDFATRTEIPISFAVWDGAKGDRNGIKLISGWHWVVIERTAEESGEKAGGK